MVIFGIIIFLIGLICSAVIAEQQQDISDSTMIFTIGFITGMPLTCAGCYFCRGPFDIC